MFIENSLSFGDNLINIIFSNKLMVSIGFETNITAFCTSQLEYYQNTPNLSEITSLAGLNTQLTDTEKNINKISFTTNADKKWFHVKCAFSNTAKEQYVSLHYKDLADVKLSLNTSIKLHNYLKTFQIDFPFRNFNTPTLNINNSLSVAASNNVLMKNLLIFSDYIKNTINFEYT